MLNFLFVFKLAYYNQFFFLILEALIQNDWSGHTGKRRDASTEFVQRRAETRENVQGGGLHEAEWPGTCHAGRYCGRRWVRIRSPEYLHE